MIRSINDITAAVSAKSFISGPRSTRFNPIGGFLPARRPDLFGDCKT